MWPLGITCQFADMESVCTYQLYSPLSIKSERNWQLILLDDLVIVIASYHRMNHLHEYCCYVL